MTLKSIEHKQKKIERNVKNLHPDNPLVAFMQMRYRELDNLKLKL